MLGGIRNATLTWQNVAVALGALALVILLGRPVLRHLFRTVVERLHKTDRIVVQLAGAAKARPPQVIRQA